MSSSRHLSVLAISYGRKLFDANDNERARMRGCAQTVKEYHMIIFSKASDQLTVTQDGQLFLHPTNSRSKLHMLFDAYRIGKAILKERPGNWVVTAQDPFEAGLVGYWLARAYSVPLNIQEHGDFFSTPYWSRDRLLNRIRYYLGKYLLKRATSVRVVADRIKKRMMCFGVPEQNIFVLPVRTDSLGDNRETHSATHLSLRDELPDDAIVILTMARLVTQKNLQLLIHAFSSLRLVDRRVVLVIVGTGPEEKRLRAEAARLGLGESIYFKDWTSDPQALMRQADIYALSSNWEGWGRVLVEAMAAGVPIVTTDVGCAGEVVKDGVHGYVVPVGDEIAFFEKLRQLVGNETLRIEYGANAKRDALQVHITPEEYADRWVEILTATYRLGTE